MGGAHSGLAYHDSDGSELAFYEQPCEAGIKPNGEHTHSLGKPLEEEEKASFFWTSSKSGVDRPHPPPPSIFDIREVTFVLAHFGQTWGNFCIGNIFKYLPNI